MVSESLEGASGGLPSSGAEALGRNPFLGAGGRFRVGPFSSASTASWEGVFGEGTGILQHESAKRSIERGAPR